jgi:hypothetical protein
MTTRLALQKVVSVLPATLSADTIYFVRIGTGFDIYVTNSTGTIVGYRTNADSLLQGGLTQIAGLTPADDDVLQRKAGSWINRTIAQLKTDLGIIGNLVQTVAIAGGTIPAYLSAAGEYWFVQNSLAQHTVKSVQATGGGTTTFGMLGFGGSAFSTVGNVTGVTPAVTNEWTQTPQNKISNNALTTSIGGLYYIIFTHFYSQAIATQFNHVSNFYFGVSDTTLYTGARMFVGDQAAIGTPLDVNPATLTNAIGLIQSPTMANPNNLYFMINGTGATPYLVDTGFVVNNTSGLKLTLIANKGSRVIGMRLTDITNNDVTFERTIDLSTLAANQQPTTGGYCGRMWRATNGVTSSSLVSINVAHIYTEIKN